MFYDEAKAHADALQEAGVPVDFQVYEGAYHGFDHIRPTVKARRRGTSIAAAVLSVALVSPFIHAVSARKHPAQKLRE